MSNVDIDLLIIKGPFKAYLLVQLFLRPQLVLYKLDHKLLSQIAAASMSCGSTQITNCWTLVEIRKLSRILVSLDIQFVRHEANLAAHSCEVSWYESHLY